PIWTTGREKEGGPMTEVEWLACEDLKRMFRFVRSRFTVHKALAFASSCDRLLRHLPGGDTSRAVPTEANYLGVTSDTEPIDQEWDSSYLIESLLNEALRLALSGSREGSRPPSDRQQVEPRHVICRLLRDLFNPFLPVNLDPSWRTRTTVGVAHRIY